MTFYPIKFDYRNLPFVKKLLVSDSNSDTLTDRLQVTFYSSTVPISSNVPISNLARGPTTFLVEIHITVGVLTAVLRTTSLTDSISVLEMSSSPLLVSPVSSTVTLPRTPIPLSYQTLVVTLCAPTKGHDWFTTLCTHFPNTLNLPTLSIQP